MKKLSVLLALMLTVSAAMYASTAKCLLHHNGNATLYDADDLDAALTAAVDGDTLYLSEGAFPELTITKKITVRGSGQMTRIGGNVAINIPNSPTLTSTMLEGFYCNAELVVLAEVNGLQIKQCRFTSVHVGANIDNVVIDKCFISNEFNLNKYWLGLTCINSKINHIYTNPCTSGWLGYGTYLSSSASINFINCNIYSIGHMNSGADYITVINSIIHDTATLEESIISNCLFGSFNGSFKYDSQKTQVNSIYTDVNEGVYLLHNKEFECRHDATALASKGYLGQDGTIVGCYGGTSPFTLDLSTPKVTATSIQIDNDTKQLSVTLNVTAK